MLGDQLDADESFDIHYLAKFLTDHDILVMPMALAFLNVYWSGLNIADKANVMCALNEYAIPAAESGPVVLDRTEITQILAALGLDEAELLASNEKLAYQFAQRGQWERAWLIASLDPGTRNQYTRTEWQRKVSIELSRTHLYQAGGSGAACSA